MRSWSAKKVTLIHGRHARPPCLIVTVTLFTHTSANSLIKPLIHSCGNRAVARIIFPFLSIKAAVQSEEANWLTHTRQLADPMGFCTGSVVLVFVSVTQHSRAVWSAGATMDRLVGTWVKSCCDYCICRLLVGQTRLFDSNHAWDSEWYSKRCIQNFKLKEK